MIMAKIIHSTFKYQDADDLHLITETTEHTYPLCDHLKHVADAFLANKVFVLERAVIECSECERRLDLQSFLEQFKL